MIMVNMEWHIRTIATDAVKVITIPFAVRNSIYFSDNKAGVYSDFYD